MTAQDMAVFEAQLVRGLKAKTIKTQLDQVYALLRYLQTRGQLASLPERPELTLPDPLPQHLAPAEVLALETHVTCWEQGARGEAWMNIGLYYLLGHGGLCISEALDLQVRDLDLPARRVRVRDGKGQRDRVVFLTEKATQALGRYLEMLPHAAEDLVLSWRGRPLGYQGAWRRIRRLGQEAGVNGLSPRGCDTPMRPCC